MDSTHYLCALRQGIVAGLKQLPAGFLQKQARYLVSAQNPDGGFSGRMGTSDLYYTSFALRALDVLDVRDPDVWRDAGAYLRTCAPEVMDIVDCVSFLCAVALVGSHESAFVPESAWAERCTGVLARFRVSTGGYARADGGSASAYHTFLAALCHESMGQAMPDPVETVQSIRGRQCGDGGFSDCGETDRGETNPTAAAVALLGMLDAPDAAIVGPAASFAASMQRPDGGLAAHAAAPASDLLSTFTALVTLNALDAVRRADLGGVGRFAKRLANESGGFRGTVMDNETDVEYAYYGLGTLGLLGLQIGCLKCKRP